MDCTFDPAVLTRPVSEDTAKCRDLSGLDPVSQHFTRHRAFVFSGIKINDQRDFKKNNNNNN